MSSPIQLPAGTVVGGDYRVVSVLSAGGMGAVYVAEQLSTGRQRALKVMHSGLVTDAIMRERFVQEARVGSLISSAHVVEVLGAGVDPALNLPWLAMELLEGQNLASYVEMRGTLPLADTVAVLRPLCHALAAAHHASIVHRDVKPENVFVARAQSTTSPVTVKVLDFGIAKVLAQARGTATAAMGTPLWMAPEQTELRSNVSATTDVWPLGLLAYYMLTGQVYWRAASTEGASVPALMREILFDDLAAPSARAAEQGVGDLIPAGFDAWFASTVVRNAEQRYADAGQALDAFCHLVAPGEASAMSQSLGPSIPPMASPTLRSVAPGAGLAPAVAVGQPAYADTSGPNAALLPSQNKRSIWPLLVGGLLALFGLAGAALAVVLLVLNPSELPPPPTSSVSPAELPTTAPEPPAPSAVREARDAALPDASAKPAPSKPAPRVSGPAVKKKHPPFDHNAAVAAVNRARNSAQRMCKSRPGPPAIAATVNYAENITRPVSITMSFKDRRTRRGVCVSGTLWSATIPIYSGKRQSIATAASF